MLISDMPLLVRQFVAEAQGYYANRPIVTYFVIYSYYPPYVGGNQTESHNAQIPSETATRLVCRP